MSPWLSINGIALGHSTPAPRRERICYPAICLSAGRVLEILCEDKSNRGLVSTATDFTHPAASSATLEKEGGVGSERL